MSLETNLIFLILFGLIGFVTEKIFGWNPYKIYSDVGTLIIASGIIFIMLPAVFNPEDINGNMDRIIFWFTGILPGAIIGDIAGSFISAITGEKRR